MISIVKINILIQIQQSVNFLEDLGTFRHKNTTVIIILIFKYGVLIQNNFDTNLHPYPMN